MPTTANLNITQGSDFYLNIVVKDDFGDVINLTNHTVGGYVKYRYGDTTPIIDLKPVITDATAGVVEINLAPSETQNYPVGQFHYGIELTSGTTVGFKTLNGKINVVPEINR